MASIGYDTFYDCQNLINIIFSKSLNSIGDFAFYGCNSLTNIIISNNVTNIGNRAFYGCESLKTASLPKHLKGKLKKVFPLRTKLIYR